VGTELCPQHRPENRRGERRREVKIKPLAVYFPALNQKTPNRSDPRISAHALGVPRLPLGIPRELGPSRRLASTSPQPCAEKGTKERNGNALGEVSTVFSRQTSFAPISLTRGIPKYSVWNRHVGAAEVHSGVDRSVG